MEKMKFVRKVKMLGVSMVISVMLAGCAAAELIYGDEAATKGYVSIHPEADGYVLPAQMYYFYPEDRNIAPTRLQCDGLGNFEGWLTPGNYRVIAVNMNTTNVSYSGMERYEMATVNATNVLNTRSRAAIETIGNVYSTVCRNLTVTLGDTIVQLPEPVLLTRFIELHIEPTATLSGQITAVEGTIRGIYPSVTLSTGTTDPEEVERSPQVAMQFDARLFGNTWMVSIQSFGLCDPKYGETYHCVLSLDLYIGDQLQSADVDLTKLLSDLMVEYGGSLPSDAALEMNIGLDWDGMNATAYIASWTIGGEDFIEVEQ